MDPSLQTPGTLKILVIGAENLDRIVTAGTQQPYYIIECGKQRSRSKPCLQNGTSPHWNTAHKFELVDETAAVAVIKDEMTKGIIAEGLIDLSRARLTGRDAATAQLRNLAGQPAGLLRFKLKFQPAGVAAPAAAQEPPRLSPAQLQRVAEAARAPMGMQSMQSDDRRSSFEAGSLPYGSRRVSDANSMPHRASEAGSYMSGGSFDGRRSATPTRGGGLPYATATLERGPSGGLRAVPGSSLSRQHSRDEPDVVLASVNNKVSLAKQAMQQLTAELAELTTGPGQSPHSQGMRRSVSPSPMSSSTPHGAFAVAAAQQAPAGSYYADGRTSSRQAGVSRDVLGQPSYQQQQQQGQQAGQAWNDYRSVWQQQRGQQQPPPPLQQQQQQWAAAAPLGRAESWNTAAGQEPPVLPMPLYQQQPYYEQRQPRISTGSATPSGRFTPTGHLSPSMSPRGSGLVPSSAGAPEGMPVQWPRLRGVFGDGVLSTEELVALYSGGAPASEKKLISLLEDALASAHAERVATEQELANVKHAMAEMTKQHYIDAKRLKEATLAAAAAAAGGGAAQAAAAPPRSQTPPPCFRYEGTPPASPRMMSMVDTKPSRSLSRQHSRTSETGQLRDVSPPPRGLTISTGREPAAAAAAATAARSPAAAAEAEAAKAELKQLRAEHARLQSASAALEQEVSRLQDQAQRSRQLEQELQQELEQLKQQQAKSSSKLPGQAAAAAVGATAGGAVAAAAAAAELEALRMEHGRVRAQAEDLEVEVEQLRGASQQVLEMQQQREQLQQQLEDLRSEHSTVKAAFSETQQQLEKLRQQQAAETRSNRSVRSVSEWQDATEEFDSSSSNGGSPMPAYKLQIQVHQLERQLVEQVNKTQEEATKRQKLAAELDALQERLDSQAAAAKQAEDNARAAERKAAEQATIAAAARAEAAESRAVRESSSGKEAHLAAELSAVKDDLEAAMTDKAELETALGLLDRNSKAQIEQLQAELVKAQEEAAALREGRSDVVSLQAQLAAAQEEASGLRNNSEEVEYLQAQLRRTLRQVVELQRQVQLLQQERSSEATTSNPDQEAAIEAAVRAETDFLMQELVAAKLELAQVKEQQLITQRQLFKAQESMKQQHAVTATTSV